MKTSDEKYRRMKTFDIRRSKERALKITRNAIDTNKADQIILGMLVLAGALKELYCK